MKNFNYGFDSSSAPSRRHISEITDQSDDEQKTTDFRVEC